MLVLYQRVAISGDG